MRNTTELTSTSRECGKPTFPRTHAIYKLTPLLPFARSRLQWLVHHMRNMRPDLTRQHVVLCWATLPRPSYQLIVGPVRATARRRGDGVDDEWHARTYGIAFPGGKRRVAVRRFHPRDAQLGMALYKGSVPLWLTPRMIEEKGV